MIIVELTGGLGNQMFQYAAGRRLALHHKTILKLKFIYYPEDTKRWYSLGCFNIKENFATDKEINKIRKIPETKIEKLIYLLNPFSKDRLIKEKDFHFDENILNTPDDVLLDGYWQSEKYFKDIEDIIRQEFSLKNQSGHIYKEFLKSIANTNSVSVHFRRKDYVEDKKTREYHGICSLEYYYTAIKKIGETIKNPHFFIFSDDIEWPRNNLKLNYPLTFVSDNNLTDCQELILMSKCKNHIIANSSFSWWGAWLSDNPKKIVIAPKKWFNDPSINTKDLIPEIWIRI
jgi:hypothetical protein